MAQDLAQVTFLSHYSRSTEDGTLETWDDVSMRVFAMHRAFLARSQSREVMEQMSDIIDEAEKAVNNKIIFPSGRSLQFGGHSILKNHAKIFNCTASFAAAPEILYKSFYLLLCGCGVGLSIQKHHVDKFPPLRAIASADCEELTLYQIPDSIKGWALAFRVLLASFFDVSKACQLDENKYVDDAKFFGKRVVFDYSKIRPKGSAIADITGKAPGPKGLRTALEKIQTYLENVATTMSQEASTNRKLRPIHVFDIMGFVSDAVLSGGVRRSAMLLLFSHDDEEMINSKVGNWFIDNPQRGRANISALLIRNKVKQEDVDDMLKKTREFGEPGFLFADSIETIVNPCAEISLFPVLEGKTESRIGFECCNLTEINVKACRDEKSFLNACRLASFVGTLQSCYTNMPFLGATTEKILNRSRLLGVSLTGIMENVDIGLDPKLLQKGAAVVKSTNEKYAKFLGINPAHRLTAVKPSGTASVVLELGACGIHPSHAERYIRRVQCADDDVIANAYAEKRPRSVDKSVWAETTKVLSFPVVLDKGVKTKQNTYAIELLNAARLVQKNWVLPGHVQERQPVGFEGTNNVSLTVNVAEDEWDSVAEHLFTYRSDFTGVSLLGNSGDVDYDQAPFERVFTIQELVEEFGDAVIFASGLIVDVKKCFGGSLHKACSTLTYGVAEVKTDDASHENVEAYEAQKLAVARIKKFAAKFFDDEKQCVACLKRVDGFYNFNMLLRENSKTSVDFENIVVDQEKFNKQSSARQGEIACSGRTCTLTRL
jgi:ribonucleoside-triphosphate reductase